MGSTHENPMAGDANNNSQSLTTSSVSLILLINLESSYLQTPPFPEPFLVWKIKGLVL
ncbi:hypothetical protein CASFOL_037180 [Castilleja foliolosa]|uniref:Uncharacterized protein n=1 Tax=Castilleja foliolosa TaxID=1961234 RepID=A0ABD3BNU2_9LAMI